MAPLVSIVLPVFNGEKYLSQSVESVLNQSYHNIELIIVNDCSTDHTESIILSYASRDSRIVYIKNESNLRLPASLNRGFSAASGEYYSWTSDDNLYHPNAIGKMCAFLKEHNEYGMVACDYQAMNESGIVQKTVRVGEAENLISSNVVGACFLYRKSVAKVVGEYRTDLFLVEDYDYWLRVSRQFPIAFHHETLYDYRLHEKSLTSERAAEIRSVLLQYQWGNLRINEKNCTSKEQLYLFFDSVLPYKKSRLQRLFHRICFGLRHWGYFSNYYRRRKNRSLAT